MLHRRGPGKYIVLDEDAPHFLGVGAALHFRAARGRRRPARVRVARRSSAGRRRPLGLNSAISRCLAPCGAVAAIATRPRATAGDSRAPIAAAPRFLAGALPPPPSTGARCLAFALPARAASRRAGGSPIAVDASFVGRASTAQLAALEPTASIADSAPFLLLFLSSPRPNLVGGSGAVTPA